MPLAGLTYRYPFVATAAWGTHIIEQSRRSSPARSTLVTGLPNNDAQSLSFDDTTLFETSKFSGYDRVEGGVRANVGVQYTFQGVGGSYTNLLFGQSYQLAGRNSYLLPDLADVGRESGLDRDRRISLGAPFAPNSTFSVMSRARFDQRTFALQRVEAGPTFNFNFISGSILYARYDAQPELGYAFRVRNIAEWQYQAELRTGASTRPPSSITIAISRRAKRSRKKLPERHRRFKPGGAFDDVGRTSIRG